MTNERASKLERALEGLAEGDCEYWSDPAQMYRDKFVAAEQRIATLEAVLREWWKLSLVVESSIREELHRDSRARETYESVCAAITATRVALAAQPATATIKESLMVHPFQPCPLDESTPGHNFTCALLCGVCGLPREKHVSQEVPRG